jgi:HEPN domain-containing protein
MAKHGPGGQSNTNTPQEWRILAERDLDAAAFLSANMRPKPLEIICFHCQQAVEKYLKGFIAFHGEEPSYTHDLDELCKVCERYNASFSAIGSMCTQLTLFGVQPRYDIGMGITEADTNLVLQNAQLIKTFLQKEAPHLFQ